MTAVYEMNDEERRITMLALAGFELDREERIAIRPLYMRLFVDSGGKLKDGVEVRPAVSKGCPHVELYAKHGGTFAPVSCPYCAAEIERDLGAKTPQEIVLQQIAAERKRQDRQWGGASHDDEHEPKDWLKYIDEHRVRAQKVASHLKDSDAYRHRLVVIAALAVAAIEAHDRRPK